MSLCRVTRTYSIAWIANIWICSNRLLRRISAIATLPFDAADARAAAAIRAALKTRGQPIGAYDVLIAGTALARGLVVVTSNPGEFKRVSGLQLEDWR